MLSQWKLPLFKGLAVAMLLKMVINSFLSHYAEGLFVLFCSILRERDRNPSSCCCQAVPPSQNYLTSAAHQPTSAHDKAAAKLTVVVLLLLPRTGMEGQWGSVPPWGVCACSHQAPAPHCPQQRGQQIQPGPGGTGDTPASRQGTTDALRGGLRASAPFLPPAFSAVSVFPLVWQCDVSCLPQAATILQYHILIRRKIMCCMLELN